MNRDVFAFVDTSALAHNLSCVREAVGPNTKILAMIKANAYGHGALQVAKALGAANGLGLISMNSAVRLRQSGVAHPIVMMQGFSTPDELKACVDYHLIPVLHHQSQLQILEKTPLSASLSCWIKVDTGMHRLGFSPEMFSDVYQYVQRHSNVNSSPVVLTHLSQADEADVAYSLEQLRCFEKITCSIDSALSICNSAGLLSFPQAHREWVRPGIMLYGISPYADREAKDFNLKPVMTLQAKLVAIREVKRGAAIGYGGQYICSENKRLGVVNIGYGDGYPRGAQSGTPVLVGDKLCALLGRVSMDMLTVDLTEHPNAKVGQIVTLWGRGLAIERVAQCANTIGYELVSQITSRVNFQFI